MCKAYFKWEGDELTEEKYIKAICPEGSTPDDGYEPCPIAKKVDVSGRDITHCDNLDKALGLTRSDDWTYESICDKVLPCKLHMCACIPLILIHSLLFLLCSPFNTQWIRHGMQKW